MSDHRVWTWQCGDCAAWTVNEGRGENECGNCRTIKPFGAALMLLHYKLPTRVSGVRQEPTVEQQQRYALRQCYLLAIRMARREQRRDDTRSSEWNHVIRFCKDADEDGNICGGSVLRQSVESPSLAPKE